MPRKSRIDARGALHHIIVRGIEGGVIFQDEIDRDRFIERLSAILSETATPCYAWALIPNHFHLLLKTGTLPVGRVMQRLLTGYAVSYNRRHGRAGHLFQNRYKSILCQEEPYLLELVRYIHLNPLRARVVTCIDELNRFAYCGHRALIGKTENVWQDTEGVLCLFSGNLRAARKLYREFVEKGLSMGHRNDLIGGGLIRSAGGWENRRDKVQKSDERILGDGEFVTEALTRAEEQMTRRYELKAKGIDLAAVIRRVTEVLGCDDVFAPGKARDRVRARSLFCYWAARELGISQAELSRQLDISAAAVTQSVKRGEILAKERGYSLL